MLTLEDMCLAHLGNVQKAIEDLQGQKLKIDDEINKLQKYLEEGKGLVDKQKSSGGSDK